MGKSNPSAIYTKWCAQPFPPMFGLFTILDRNFAKIVAPPSDKYENYVVPLKEQSLVKQELSSADADNRLDAFSGQSRSTNMVPFHM